MLAIIGGTGLYQIEDLEKKEDFFVQTPFGNPSAKISQASYLGIPVLFLPRHGQKHELLPHEINYRANLWALKTLGCKQIIAISAVGSLKEEIKPGDFSIPYQYFDFVKGSRAKSFFGNGIAAHISTALPTCPNLTKAIKEKADTLNIPLHVDTTYACVDGPRLGTKAESKFLRHSAQCDLVGMTGVPEAFLSREAQICYCSICVVTDYDCWKEAPDTHVSLSQVIDRYSKSIHQVKSLLKSLVQDGLPPTDPLCRSSLQEAVLTPEDFLSEEKKELLAVLKR